MVRNPRPLLLCVILLAALLPSVPPGGAQETVPAPTDEPINRVLVGVHQLPPVQAGGELFGGRVHAVVPAIRLIILDAADPAAIMSQARGDPNVRYAEQDRVVSPPYASSEPRIMDQWAVHAMNAPRAWDATRGNARIIIAVIDSGHLPTHEEFQDTDRFLPGYDFARGDSVPDEECDHGTGGTSLIAGSMYNGKGIAGLAEVRIVPLKIYSDYDLTSGRNCLGTYSSAAQALVRAADMGAHIASAQWQGSVSFQALNDSVDYAYGRGVILIGSAGNWGSTCGKPSCVTAAWADRSDKVIAVAATGPTETGYFSSVGPEVDVTAPGVSVLMASDASTTAYGYRSGTSFSAPNAAGVMALLKSSAPKATREQLTQRLLETAKDMGPAGKDPTYGWGMVDAGRAVAGWPAPFDANFSQVAGNEWWMQVHVDGNHPITGVQGRIGTGAWQSLKLQPWGKWALSVAIPSGSVVQFRAVDDRGASDPSRCYAWPAATFTSCPASTDPTSDPIRFAHKGGNEWWVEVDVQPAPVSVSAMDTGGPWVTLEKKSWGPWAGSFHIAAGNQVRFRATFSNGTTVESCWFSHPAGVAQCTPVGPTETTFAHKGGNEWWVEARVDPKPVSVEARDTGGPWVALSLRDWGHWAGSFHIQAGHQVQFRASYADGRVVESCWFSHPGGVASCTTGPAPTFDATFTGVKGNEWWLEAKVTATGGTLARVDARVNGGAWVALELKSWGSWAKSVYAPKGSVVEFRAVAQDAQTDVSDKYVWPPPA